MRLFSEKVNPTFNSSGYNILTVKDYTEVFFDVYEFEINGSRFVAEKTGELDDAPIISIPVDYNNIVENYDFVLHKGEQSIHFDPSTQSTPSQIKSVPDVEPLLTESVEEETDEVFLEEKKSAILEEIEKAKIAAAKYIKSIEKQNKRELVSYQTEREIALKEDIEKQKKILLDEFYSFVDQLKDRIAEESSDTALELKDIISEQLTSVSKDIDTRLSSAEKAIDTKLEERANELLNDVLLSEVKRSGKEIADDLNSQVKTIAENISKSLTSTRKQIEVDINEKLQEISTELNAKDKAIVELNDTLTKQSNRALSRIGTVKTQLESTVQDVVNSLEARIETASDRLEKYYAEKLQLVESSMTNVSEETKKHIIDLIKESHQSLQADIANIKVTVPNIVIEKSNGNQEIDVAALRTELEKSVSNRFVNEISSLKRLIELSSGGGSVAMQFAAGGTMQGNLTVVGTISARQYLGIPGGSATGAYLPLSGGTVTGDVSVSGLLSANRIGFNTGAGLTAGIGQLTWNDTDGTLDLGLKGGNVTLQIGQEAVARVVNKTGADLLESQYRVVRIRSTAEGGAQGQRLAVVLAQANNDAGSVDTLGIVTENIGDNQEGFVTTSGLVRNINTTGSLQGETWLDGDVLYLSPTTLGALTKVKPQAPQHTVIVGFVVYKHQNQGKIFVKVDNGYELDELHNVRITSVSANDVLKYNGTAGVWENSNTLTLSALSATSISISGVQAATVNSNVASATVLQTPRLINGVSFNGSSDITVTVPISSGVTGLGSGISAFLATPTSDNLRNAVTNETGTGSLVFAESPTLTSPTLSSFYASSLPDTLSMCVRDGPIPKFRLFEDFGSAGINAVAGVGNNGFNFTSTGARGSNAVYTQTFANRGINVLAHGINSIITGNQLADGAWYLLPLGGGGMVGCSGQYSFALSGSPVAVPNTIVDMRIGLNANVVIFEINTATGQLNVAQSGTVGSSTTTLLSGITLSGGNFSYGTRYRFYYKIISSTQVDIYFASAPFNSTTWTAIYNGVATIPAMTLNGTENLVYPYFGLRTNETATKTMYIDWIAVEKDVTR